MPVALGCRCKSLLPATLLFTAACLAAGDSDITTAARLSRFPSFQELHERLFGVQPDDKNDSTHVILSFSNPYKLKPNFRSYPHSNLLPQFFADLVETLQADGGPHFVVEAGSLHGHSAIQMATVLDKLGLTEVPVLCIDPFTGDTNMWATYHEDPSVRGWVNIRDGRMTVFDQFMVNVQFALNRSLTRHHILPFHATSIVGARWLDQMAYTPDLIFLDSAHELHETFLEISLFYKVLRPGGILFGDDYGWEAVRLDVHRFAEEHNAMNPHEPLELRIIRAKPGVTNVLWVMRKAKV